MRRKSARSVPKQNEKDNERKPESQESDETPVKRLRKSIAKSEDAHNELSSLRVLIGPIDLDALGQSRTTRGRTSQSSRAGITKEVKVALDDISPNVKQASKMKPTRRSRLSDSLPVTHEVSSIKTGTSSVGTRKPDTSRTSSSKAETPRVHLRKLEIHKAESGGTGTPSASSAKTRTPRSSRTATRAPSKSRGGTKRKGAPSTKYKQTLEDEIPMKIEKPEPSGRSLRERKIVDSGEVKSSSRFKRKFSDEGEVTPAKKTDVRPAHQKRTPRTKRGSAHPSPSKTKRGSKTKKAKTPTVKKSPATRRVPRTPRTPKTTNAKIERIKQQYKLKEVSVVVGLDAKYVILDGSVRLDGESEKQEAFDSKSILSVVADVGDDAGESSKKHSLEELQLQKQSDGLKEEKSSNIAADELANVSPEPAGVSETEKVAEALEIDSKKVGDIAESEATFDAEKTKCLTDDCEESSEVVDASAIDGASKSKDPHEDFVASSTTMGAVEVTQAGDSSEHIAGEEALKQDDADAGVYSFQISRHEDAKEIDAVDGNFDIHVGDASDSPELLQSLELTGQYDKMQVIDEMEGSEDGDEDDLVKSETHFEMKDEILETLSCSSGSCDAGASLVSPRKDLLTPVKLNTIPAEQEHLSDTDLELNSAIQSWIEPNIEEAQKDIELDLVEQFCEDDEKGDLTLTCMSDKELEIIDGDKDREFLETPEHRSSTSKEQANVGAIMEDVITLDEEAESSVEVVEATRCDGEKCHAGNTTFTIEDRENVEDCDIILDPKEAKTNGEDHIKKGTCEDGKGCHVDIADESVISGEKPHTKENKRIGKERRAKDHTSKMGKSWSSDAGTSEKSGKTRDFEQESVSNVKTIIMKGKSPVDPECTEKIHVAHVFCEGNTVWAVTLNQTNVQRNNNKYYILQLLEDDCSRNYNVWMHWGRVGHKGTNKLVPCGPDLEKAKEVFCNKFTSKTFNEWYFLKTFKKIEGKYDIVAIDYEPDATKASTELKNKKAKLVIPESSLEKRVQDLVALVCDITAMESVVKEMQFDAKNAPLGKLTSEQIKAGYVALKRIENYVVNDDFGPNLISACNDFYTRIPHTFGMRKPPLISSREEIRKKLQLLETLSDIEIAIKVLNQPSDVIENPIDARYHSLKCDIEPIEKSSEEFKLIEKYLQNTHAKTHRMYKMILQEVFRFTKETEKFKDYGNKRLLWHGSRLTNWASILAKGLRIAPPEAPSTGFMFGKGVYFADMSSKSANYCYPSKSSPIGLLLLSEVSLGSCRELKEADYDADRLPKGKHSVKGLGAIVPDVNEEVTLPDGTVVPLGHGVEIDPKQRAAYVLNYNEYVVYDTSQINPRYIVQVKFDFVKI